MKKLCAAAGIPVASCVAILTAAIMVIVPTGPVGAATPATWCRPEGILRASALPRVIDPAQCAMIGRIVRDGPVAATVPPRGLGVAVEALTPTGEEALVVVTRPDGTVVLSRTGSERAAARRAAASARSGPTVPLDPSACSDTAHTFTGWTVSGSFHWYFNKSSTPSEVNADNAETAVLNATRAWPQETNDCGRSDAVSASQFYEGVTTQGVNIDTQGQCTTNDGLNVIGFGTLPSGTVGETCTWFSGGTVVESDARLNKGVYDWTANPTGSCSNKYDVQSVATHERGHTFGLDHPGSGHANLTMYAFAFTCDTRARTLGLGDMLGVEALY